MSVATVAEPKLLIRTVQDQTDFAPGDRVQIVAGWELPYEPDAMHVRLVFFTEGTGNRDVVVAAEDVMEAPGARGSHSIELRLPHAPYSLTSKLLSIKWAVELIAAPTLDSSLLEICVAPGGQPIVIESD